MTECVDAGSGKCRHRDHVRWTILCLYIAHDVCEHEASFGVSMMDLHSDTIICSDDIKWLKCLTIDHVFRDAESYDEIAGDI